VGGGEGVDGLGVISLNCLEKKAPASQSTLSIGQCRVKPKAIGFIKCKKSMLGGSQVFFFLRPLGSGF
jgi:hypothetical protein